MKFALLIVAITLASALRLNSVQHASEVAPSLLRSPCMIWSSIICSRTLTVMSSSSLTPTPTPTTTLIPILTTSQLNNISPTSLQDQLWTARTPQHCEIGSELPWETPSWNTLIQGLSRLTESQALIFTISVMLTSDFGLPLRSLLIRMWPCTQDPLLKTPIFSKSTSRRETPFDLHQTIIHYL